jgi:NADH/NAD ratio-sensing transcriptional regulator Rex
MKLMKRSNYKWNTLSNDETSILKDMSINNFSSQLPFNDMRNVVKIEIEKIPIKEVKNLKRFIQAKNAKQIIFCFPFCSTQQTKKKLFVSDKQTSSNHAL